MSTVIEQLFVIVPPLLGAVAILIVGFILANVAKGIVGKLLDMVLGNEMVSGLIRGDAEPGSEEERSVKQTIVSAVSTGIFWIAMLFVLLAFFNALQLTIVSGPIEGLLSQVFEFLPNILGGAALALVAWILATVVKLVVGNGLENFNLNQRLGLETEAESSESVSLTDTLANVLYWFVWLLFVPAILDALALEGPLLPIQNMIDTILAALPNIFMAVIIGAVGFFIARIVRGIATNLLAAAGADRLGEQMGLSASQGGQDLSVLLGNLAFALVIIPAGIAALQALQIEVISRPATTMLNKVLEALPNVFAAAIVLTVSYVIGKLVSGFVANLLAGLGFDRIFDMLGLSAATSDAPAEGDAPSDGITNTPSEIVGLIVLAGTMLFAITEAANLLNFTMINELVGEFILLASKVLFGVVILGAGLYLATLAHNVVVSAAGGNSPLLAQVTRVAIIILSAAIALRQIGIANEIVNLAFGLLLGAIAVAVAISFGLGGREAAGEQVREWLQSMKSTPSSGGSTPPAGGLPPAPGSSEGQGPGLF
ncbi:MAG: mechanosensitive ion channel [Cyanobacteria bacterium J06642_2]